MRLYVNVKADSATIYVIRTAIHGSANTSCIITVAIERHTAELVRHKAIHGGGNTSYGTLAEYGKQGVT